MLSNLKKKISDLTGLKEFLVCGLILFIVLNLFLSISDYSSVYILLFIFWVILFIAVQRKIAKNISLIKKVIKNIREKKYTVSSEIELKNNYNGIETEIRLMFDRIKEDIDYLKKLEKMRTEFLGNVSHELRTPIFAIQGYIETLLNGALNDQKVNTYFLEKADFHTQNLNSLLNDLIDISMIETGEMRLSFRYFKLSEYLKAIWEEFKPMAEEKNLQLILAPVRENLDVFGDKAKLKQVFSNLIQNAIKYTETGQIEIIVEEAVKGSVKISIKDTGLGIPEEDLDRIFERFYRVDKNRSRAVGGTGLGLAIVKHILEAHNSKIQVKSVLDEGSEFYFSLKK